MTNIIHKYFIKPAETLEGYNVVNTVVYSLLFVTFAYVIYRFLRKIKIEIDNKFFLSNIPFILWGVLYRIQVDLGKFPPSIITVTPGVWIITFFITIGSLVISWKVKKEEYWKCHSATGTLILFFSSLFIFSFPSLGYNVIVWSILFFATLLILIKLPERLYLVALFGEFTDALGSYVGIKFGFREEHVLGSFIVENFCPELFLFVKIIVTIFVLWYIHKSLEDISLKNYLYFAIFVLGFGPGSRDWLILGIY